MLSASRSKFVPRLIWIAVVVLLLGGTGLAVRYWLGGYVVRSVLRLAGADQIKFSAVHGTPARLVVDNLSFRVGTQPLVARRVTLERDRWWTASLGRVRVDGAEMPVVLDGSNVDPWNWTTYEDTGLGDEPVTFPFETLALEGELIVRMALVSDRRIAIRLEAQPRSGTSWIGSLVAKGEGFHLAGSGSLLRAGQELDFQVHSTELDLALWSSHVQRLVTLPGGPWELGGRLTGVAEGNVTARRFAATARITLRDGRMRANTQDVAVRGAEADLEFSDLWKLRTKSGRLRLAELRIGRLPVRAVEADFGLWNGSQIDVTRATGRLLGGRVETEPFRFKLHERSLALVLHPTGISAGALLDLTAGVEPRLGARLDGRLPLRITGDGVQVTNGLLILPPGRGGDLQFNAAGLLRSGTPLDGATEQVLKGAGRSSVLVRLDEFRLEVRPPGLPLGTSGRATVTGQIDGKPVQFTYPVNGALEGYLRIMP